MVCTKAVEANSYARRFSMKSQGLLYTKRSCLSVHRSSFSDLHVRRDDICSICKKYPKSRTNSQHHLSSTKNRLSLLLGEYGQGLCFKVAAT